MWVTLTSQDHESISVIRERITMVKTCDRGCLIYLDSGTNIHVREGKEQVMRLVEDASLSEEEAMRCT